MSLTSNQIKVIGIALLVFGAGLYVFKVILDKNAQNAAAQAIKSYQENPLNKIPPLKSLNGTVTETGKGYFFMDVSNIRGIEIQPAFRMRKVVLNDETAFYELKVMPPADGSQQPKVEKKSVSPRVMSAGAKAIVASASDIQNMGWFVAKEVLIPVN